MSLFVRGIHRIGHLSDETLTRLLSSELSTVRSLRARGHIARCWQCRSRRDALDRAAMQITEHRKLLAAVIPSSSSRRAQLLADLRQRATRRARPSLGVRFSLFLHRVVANQMNPLLASTAIVVSASLLLAWVWTRPPAAVTPMQLLDRAQASDHRVAQEHTGVLYQRVSITTSRYHIEHEIYRDLRGIRRRRAERLNADVQPVRQLLSSVGVDWQAPLSATSYEAWHARQTSASDEVHATGGNLLTLVTRVPTGPILRESLTVRASDFHPVGRTVEARDYGTIEIAELSYAVLDWSAINENLFEPLPQPVPDAPLAEPHLEPIVPRPLPSPAALDSAELSVRLALNQLHADEGEQITVSRTDRTIEVQGVVETSERRQQILSALSGLPHVSADILSLSEQQSHPPASPASASVQVQSVAASPSPLEIYLDSSGRGSELSALSQQILDSILRIRQSSGQLLDLRIRFADAPPGDAIAIATLSASYTQRLRAALDAEESALRDLRLLAPPQSSSPSGSSSLAAEVDRNENLCRAFITGGTTARSGSAPSVTDLVPDLYLTIAHIRLLLAPPSPPPSPRSITGKR